MIQRQQSLWLLLSAITAALSFEFPFYTGTLIKDGKYDELFAGSSLPLVALTGLTLLLAVITIFLFKDRKLQLRLSIVGIFLSIFVLIVYFLEKRAYANGSLSFHCLYVLAMIVGFIMAARGIWKDEKLVKSLDKLR